MDFTSFLDNSQSSLPVNLMGLSPGEIQGISANRGRRDQSMMQMMNFLAGQPGREASVRASDASTRLREAQLKGLENPQMSEISDPTTGKKYQVPRKALTQSLVHMADLKRKQSAGQLDDARVEQLNKTRNLTIDGKNYGDVPVAQFASISKSLSEINKADEKREATLKLANMSPEQMMQPENVGNLLIANPNAFTAMVNRQTPGTLSPNVIARYTGMSYQLGQRLFGSEGTKENPDAADVASYNMLNKALRSRHGALKVPKIKKFLGIDRAAPDSTQAVSVPLPVGLTMEDVYLIASELQKSVPDILQMYYDKLQEKGLN